jgi:hypothetical protein
VFTPGNRFLNESSSICNRSQARLLLSPNFADEFRGIDHALAEWIFRTDIQIEVFVEGAVHRR